ncbi:MAG: serpin family protein [Clostridia bacterium]|nr:serpin family protein [Clostridia bacterium]
MKTKITAIILILVLTLSITLSGCSEGVVRNLSDDIEPDTYILYDDIFKPEDYSDFASKLFEKCFDGEGNTLVSPLSIALAFAMVAEGADNETLAEIEDVLGMNIEELRVFAQDFLKDNKQLSTSNSLWINNIDGFNVNKDFLENNSAYHNAEVFEGKFNDKIVEEINNWVNDKTEGMIDKIVDNLDERSVMCLINALLFDAKWEEEYKEHQVNDGVFTTEKGEINPVKYLDGSENIYIKDENAKGFVKYYDGRDYAFVALLPDAGVSVKDYIKTLDGKKIDELLKNAEETKVITRLPKFEYETNLSLNSVLKDMGMKEAFDEKKADFSKIGQIQGGNIWIGDVLHSTKITVAEQGTKAGAATAVIKYGAGASPAQEEPKEVYLERPFVYMIIDMENNLPVFIGTVMSVGE